MGLLVFRMMLNPQSHWLRQGWVEALVLNWGITHVVLSMAPRYFNGPSMPGNLGSIRAPSGGIRGPVLPCAAECLGIKFCKCVLMK